MIFGDFLIAYKPSGIFGTWTPDTQVERTMVTVNDPYWLSSGFRIYENTLWIYGKEQQIAAIGFPAKVVLVAMEKRL
jgi:surface antigen